MLESKDIARLLIELRPMFDNDKALHPWLEREGISEDAYDNLARDLMSIVADHISDSAGDIISGIEGMMATLQLAFFIGWECGKEYAPRRRDMSQEEL